MVLGDLKNETAEEIQNALCTITTKELEASANATITRQLRGVCTSNEFNLKIDKLQMKILQEIDSIRYILEMNGFKIPDVGVKSIESYESSDPKQISYKSGNFATTSTRTEEILLYNNTILDTVDGRKFSYYWEIQNIRQLLAKSDMYKSSPIFRVLANLGFRMFACLPVKLYESILRSHNDKNGDGLLLRIRHDIRLQLYPNHLKKNYFGIGLRPDSPGFLKKHKISILNLLYPGSDIESEILYGLNDKKTFRSSTKNLELEGFIMGGSLVVKLEIYLNS
ncbi:hypothetical protein NQ318_012421 [Aromia moschata]|uniref:Uncharacterized protein n=1 Tax=Aromia moschata TaxID=1265417 RepID=A0AAV8Y2N6_9CUCU|nr:hypothetical protein NQ318_012421 [Aromia moschata]